jgi:predicted DNA-binding protein (MmcQ/YjbR family)
MHKQHWNTVEIDGNVSDNLILEWIGHSYNLIAGSKTKRK